MTWVVANYGRHLSFPSARLVFDSWLSTRSREHNVIRFCIAILPQPWPLAVDAAAAVAVSFLMFAHWGWVKKQGFDLARYLCQILRRAARWRDRVFEIIDVVDPSVFWIWFVSCIQPFKVAPDVVQMNAMYVSGNMQPLIWLDHGPEWQYNIVLPYRHAILQLLDFSGEQLTDSGRIFMCLCMLLTSTILITCWKDFW